MCIRDSSSSLNSLSHFRSHNLYWLIGIRDIVSAASTYSTDIFVTLVRSGYEIRTKTIANRVNVNAEVFAEKKQNHLEGEGLV